VSVEPDHVAVFSGYTHALAVLARTFVSLGLRRVVMEDPCVPFHRELVARAGLDIVPAPVDANGINAARVAAAHAGAVIVTPAHQSPLGVVLTPTRRAALVTWARDTGGLVVEDDYDAELRYDRQPVGALQGLAPDDVVYAGTASKTLAPALRLAWLVLTSRVQGAFADEVRYQPTVPTLDQLALADLLETGRWDRHLRRMRRAYRTRRDLFLRAIMDGAPTCRVSGIAAGLHLLVELPVGIDDDAVVAEAARRDIALDTLSSYFHRGRGPAAVIIGDGRVPAHAVPQAADALGQLVADIIPK
jgi:GntR family transcriptional regulator/MocR family aminotransferase